jgi:hypothetical protein
MEHTYLSAACTYKCYYQAEVLVYEPLQANYVQASESWFYSGMNSTEGTKSTMKTTCTVKNLESNP